MKRHAVEPLRVLIVSATVGAGDAGNARELARRLARDGHHVFIRDFLEAAPLGAGKALSKGYEAELRHAPWAYELAFSVWYWLPFLLSPLARLLSLFTRRAVMRWANEAQADVVVSTYPVATQVLGDLRRRAKRRWRWLRHGGLHVPAVNFITDFGYHPFWAHRGIDLNLAVHPSTVAAVARRTGKPSMACAPLVGPEFARAPLRRGSQRALFGLRDDEVAVLISSGSWGVGTVQEALECVAREPGLVPVVTCGHNTVMHRHLGHLVTEKCYRAMVLGWTDDMAGVMAACDVLVENAGGLTSLEAMRAGLPLVSFRPIPGHGRKSAAVMSAAGVSYLAHSRSNLAASLAELGHPGPLRQAELEAASSLFTNDAALAVAQVGEWGPPPPAPVRRVARVARVASAAALVGALSWFGLTTGVGVAAAAGAGVAHPPAGRLDTIYVGVRLDRQELADPEVQATLLELDASAVVDLNTATTEPTAVRSLVSLGVDLESGGLGFRPGEVGAPRAPWSWARSDSKAVQELSVIAGEPVPALVPDRSLSAFDLVDASADHLMMVVPDTVLPLAPSGPSPQEELALPPLQAEQIYLVNGPSISTTQLVVLLDNLNAELTSERLATAPLSNLQ